MFIYYFKNISNNQETMSNLVLKKRHDKCFFCLQKKKKEKKNEKKNERMKQNTQKKKRYILTG